MTMDPQATAGRIVHYYSGAEQDRSPIAAIVNRKAEPDGKAELTVFVTPPVQVIAAYSETPAPGCWSWMPYQKAKAAQAGGNQSESAEPRPA